MANRVTPVEIEEMNRSGSTVRRYIKLYGTPAIVAHTFKEVVRE